MTDIDLTRQFVENGRTLAEWAGLTDRIRLVEGSVLDVQYGDGSMDAVYMIQVGMNVADKASIAKEAARGLRQLCQFFSFRVRDLVETFRSRRPRNMLERRWLRRKRVVRSRVT